MHNWWANQAEHRHFPSTVIFAEWLLRRPAFVYPYRHCGGTTLCRLLKAKRGGNKKKRTKIMSNCIATRFYTNTTKTSIVFAGSARTTNKKTPYSYACIHAHNAMKWWSKCMCFQRLCTRDVCTRLQVNTSVLVHVPHLNQQPSFVCFWYVRPELLDYNMQTLTLCPELDWPQ